MWCRESAGECTGRCPARPRKRPGKQVKWRQRPGGKSLSGVVIWLNRKCHCTGKPAPTKRNHEPGGPDARVPAGKAHRKHAEPRSPREAERPSPHGLIQEIRAIECVALGRFEPGVPDNSAELFFRGAIRYTRGTYHIFFEHDRSDVVAAEAQTHLTDFQSLGHPARLHIQEVREVQPGNG